MFCSGKTVARKRYERDVMKWMTVYLVVILSSALCVKHEVGGKFFLYFWSVLPSLPIIGVIVRMGRYLREETDEYQRLLVMQSLLIGTGALVGAMMVSDFLRAFAEVKGLPPFAGFVIFGVSMGITQAVQRLRDRTVDDDEPSA